MAVYKRILLKFSGEALAGPQKHGIDSNTLHFFANEIIQVAKQKVQIGIVVGGGNIVRGSQVQGIDRISADYMGMLATVINGLALASKLKQLGQPAKVLTSTFMEPYAERYTPQRAIEALEQGQVVIFSGGTSNPFFTTDSAAALKAIEIQADILLKGTNVDGVYDSDPKINPNAKRYDKISFQQVLEKELKVMDLTAFALCKQNNIPIIVFNIHTPGNLLKIINGQLIGTLVK